MERLVDILLAEQGYGVAIVAWVLLTDVILISWILLISSQD